MWPRRSGLPRLGHRRQRHRRDPARRSRPRPHDRDLSDLVGQLSTRSDEFRRRWAAHNVRIHSTGVKLFHHPLVGDLDLPYESLPLEPGSSTALVAYTPEPDTATQDALALLASWTASETASDQATQTRQDRRLR